MPDTFGLMPTYPLASAGGSGKANAPVFINLDPSGLANTSVGAYLDPNFMAIDQGLRHLDPFALASTYVVVGREPVGMARSRLPAVVRGSHDHEPSWTEGVSTLRSFAGSRISDDGFCIARPILSAP